MAKTPKHKWTFTSRLRRNAFGWRGSKLAGKRLQEAVKEIQKVAKKDPVLAGEGAVKFMEKLWPALEQIDTSSGYLGGVTDRTVRSLIPIIVNAPVTLVTRHKWMERLWEAVCEDGVDYLSPVQEEWGDLCGSPEEASIWVNRLLPDFIAAWSDDNRYIMLNGTCVLLSSLLKAGRHDELFRLLNLRKSLILPYSRFGAYALASDGEIDEAIAYLEAYRGTLNVIDWEVDHYCEDLLLKYGQVERAYREYAPGANYANTNLATFRLIAKKYPHVPPEQILDDLIERSPGREGKWFATAKTLGFLKKAVELAQKSSVDPMTLDRAAKLYETKKPEYAIEFAVLALHWASRGSGYDLEAFHVETIIERAFRIAETMNVTDKLRSDIERMASHSELIRCAYEHYQNFLGGHYLDR